MNIGPSKPPPPPPPPPPFIGALLGMALMLASCSNSPPTVGIGPSKPPPPPPPPAQPTVMPSAETPPAPSK